MAGQELEHFVHAEGAEPRVVKAEPGDRLREVLIRIEVLAEGGERPHVFIGECKDALVEAIEIEEGEDAHEPVDIELTLEVLELHRHRHVHVHRCRRIAVEVNFMNKTKKHKFSPATTIDTVAAWARRKLGLDPQTAGEYMLEICRTDNQPRGTTHLGDLVHGPVCAICFNLVKEVTPQG